MKPLYQHHKINSDKLLPYLQLVSQILGVDEEGRIQLCWKKMGSSPEIPPRGICFKFSPRKIPLHAEARGGASGATWHLVVSVSSKDLFRSCGRQVAGFQSLSVIGNFLFFFLLPLIVYILGSSALCPCEGQLFVPRIT